MQGFSWDEISQKLRYASSDEVICGMSYKDAAEKLLGEGRRRQDPEYLALAWYCLAVKQSEDAHSADKGTEYLTLALEQAKICRDYELINAIYLLLGQMLRSQRIYSQAMEYFLQAARAGKKCPNPDWSVGIANVEIAILYHHIGEFKLAFQSMLTALHNMEPQKGQMHYDRYMITAHIQLAHWYLDGYQDTVSAAREIKILKDQFEGCSIWSTEHYDIRFLCLQMHLIDYVGPQSAIPAMVEQVIPMLRDAIDDTRIFYDLCGLLIDMTERKAFAACEEVADMARQFSRDSLPGIRSQILELLIRYYDAAGKTEERDRTCYEYYQAMQEQQKDEQHIVVRTMHRQQAQDQVQDENRRLSHEAETDALTQLPNRYGMNANASAFYEDCYEKQIPFGFEVMDLDFFKEFNDTYGHQAGDMVLQKVAKVVQELQKNDPDVYAARYGGDEIVVLYRGKSNEEIAETTSWIDEQVRSLSIPHKNSHCADIVTVSQGVVNTVPVNAVRLWDYMSSADVALYDVKNNGKGNWRIVNEIHTAEDETLQQDQNATS